MTNTNKKVSIFLLKDDRIAYMSPEGASYLTTMYNIGSDHVILNVSTVDLFALTKRTKMLPVENIIDILTAIKPSIGLLRDVFLLYADELLRLSIGITELRSYYVD